MFQRLSVQLPPWARREHPVLRYGLGSARPSPRRRRYVRAFLYVMAAITLLLVGHLIATGGLRHASGQNLTESLMAVLFWPSLVVQTAIRLGVLALTVSTVSEHIRRQNWDNLRATENGVELTLRARWAGVFYQLRGLIGVLLLVRVILILGILYDLTAFRGGYLDRLLNGVTPEISVLVSVPLLAFLMTASLLLPLTGVGFDAAVGLLVSVAVRQRIYTALLQVILSLARVALVAGLAYAMTRLFNGQLALHEVLAWMLALAFGGMGDWGLAMLHLGFYGELWATIPYGIFLGAALLIFALVQAMLTDAILGYAIRHAERSG